QAEPFQVATHACRDWPGPSKIAGDSAPTSLPYAHAPLLLSQMPNQQGLKLYDLLCRAVVRRDDWESSLGGMRWNNGDGSGRRAECGHSDCALGKSTEQHLINPSLWIERWDTHGSTPRDVSGCL